MFRDFDVYIYASKPPLICILNMFIAVNEYDLHCIDVHVVRTCIYVCVIYQRIQDFLHV